MHHPAPPRISAKQSNQIVTIKVQYEGTVNAYAIMSRVTEAMFIFLCSMATATATATDNLTEKSLDSFLHRI
jgi:hypothetical protein